MADSWIAVLSLLAALGSGINAGFFFTFSAVIMAALARRPAAEGIAAMQSINVVVLNAWFFTVFFGTAAICLVLAGYALLNFDAPGAVALLSGSLLYLVGTILVTMTRNVPLNIALAAVAPDSDKGAALWSRYLREWTAWNHVRTVAPLLAAALFIQALRS
jgi:uncharacterized membrane protein